jgi:long-chain acyl-CoA synthetase
VVVSLRDLLGLRGRLVDFAARRLKRAIPAWSLPGATKFGDVLRAGVPMQRPLEVKSSNLALLQYTGGTTGAAKGAMLTHRNVMANVTQINAWTQPFLRNDLQQTMVTALPI